MRLLNIGCGPRGAPMPAHYHGWDVVRLDIEPTHEPDLLMDALDVGDLAGEDYDAAYASHLIEHIYIWQLEQFLGGVHRALGPDGFLELRVPDAMAAVRVAARAGTLDARCYESSPGWVTAWDMLYGYAAYQHRYREPMVHRNGFEERTVIATLRAHGFPNVLVARNEWEIDAIGCKTDLSPEMMRRLHERATGEDRPVHPDVRATNLAAVRQLRTVAEAPPEQPSRNTGGCHPPAATAADRRGPKLPRGAGLGRRL